MKQSGKNLFSVSNLLNNERERHQNFDPDAAGWGWIGNPLSTREKALLCNESCCFANEVCQNSNLHGLKYVGNSPGHYFERLFFGIFFILGILASVYLILEAVKKYKDSPTFVTFLEKDVKIDHIPFPAITICTVNNVSKKKAMQIINEGLSASPDQLSEKTIDDLEFLDNICETTTSSFTSKYVNDDEPVQDLIDVSFPDFRAGGMLDALFLDQTPYEVEEKVFNMTQSCEDMILLCLWQNKQKNCSDLFVEVLTDYGKCCVFNMAPVSLLFHNDKIKDRMPLDTVEIWNSTNLNMENLLTSDASSDIHSQPRRVKRAGLYHGLSFLLNPDIGDYFCPASDSFGFQLSAHVPIEFPRVADFGEAIALSTENFIKVTADVTTADEEIRSLEIDVRKCYFAGEKTLKYFTKYTQRNCLDECLAELTYKTCNCTKFYMPKDDDRELCGRGSMYCVNGNIQIQLVEHNWDITDWCKDCFPTCTDFDYGIEVTSRYMREDINIWARTEEELKKTNDSQFSIVHVYFAEDSTYPKIRRRLVGVIDVIANIGGLLGLCLGFSILSGVELLYLLIVRVCGKSCIVTKMIIKRKLINEYRLQKAVDPGGYPPARRKMKRNESRRIITTQPLSQSHSSMYHNGTFRHVLPNYFLDEVAPRFATGNNLRYY